MRPIVTAFVLVAVALAWSKPASAQTPADIVLLNGKIVTVDDRFTIGEALAIKGERILAVGSNAEIEKHKGPLTRVVRPRWSHRHPGADRQPRALHACRRVLASRSAARRRHLAQRSARADQA